MLEPILNKILILISNCHPQGDSPQWLQKGAACWRRSNSAKILHFISGGRLEIFSKKEINFCYIWWKNCSAIFSFQSRSHSLTANVDAKHLQIARLILRYSISIPYFNSKSFTNDWFSKHMQVGIIHPYFGIWQPFFSYSYFKIIASLL